MRVILLRGLARESAHWLDFPIQLKERLGDSSTIEFIDFPGCGVHYRQDALTSVAAMTNHARTESNAANSLERIYIIGISMGGMIALDWAQRFPSEIQGIALINSSAGDQPFWWRLRPRAWLPLLSALVLPCRLRESLVLTCVSNCVEQYPIHLKQWLDIQQQRPVSWNTLITMLYAAAHYRPQQSCAINGIVLASKQDRLVSIRASQALAERFSWRLLIHPQAGHDLPMDAPGWVCEQVVRHIRGADS